MNRIEIIPSRRQTATEPGVSIMIYDEDNMEIGIPISLFYFRNTRYFQLISNECKESYDYNQILTYNPWSLQRKEKVIRYTLFKSQDPDGIRLIKVFNLDELNKDKTMVAFLTEHYLLVFYNLDYINNIFTKSR